MSGWAPGADRVMAVPDIGSVADPGAQRMFLYLIEENRRIYCALNDSIEASRAATAGLATVTTALESTCSQLAAVLPQISQVIPHVNGVLPSVINASSPVGSLSNMSGDSVLSSGSSNSSDGLLQCPFCTHRHSSEKVHHQHLVRLLDRFVLINLLFKAM